LLCVFLISAQPVSATPSLAGTYNITENTDLGSEVRITVELHLVNASDTSVTITSVAVRSISSPLHLVSAPANLFMQSRSKAQTTVQFLIPKKDFATWSAGPHRKFLVKFHSADEKPALANVLLLQTKG